MIKAVSIDLPFEMILRLGDKVDVEESGPTASRSLLLQRYIHHTQECRLWYIFTTPPASLSLRMRSRPPPLPRKLYTFGDCEPTKVHKTPPTAVVLYHLCEISSISLCCSAVTWSSAGSPNPTATTPSLYRNVSFPSYLSRQNYTPSIACPCVLQYV